MPDTPPPRDRSDPFSHESIEDLCRPPELEKYLEEGVGKKRYLKPWVKIILLMGLCLIGFLLFSRVEKKDPSLPEKFVYLKGAYPEFVGRERYLDLLYKDLIQNRDHKDFWQTLGIKQLWGKGGYGKTELAIEFANRFISEFSLVWTFYCDTPEHIERGYRNLAEKLKILDSKDPLNKVKEKVHLYLENHRFSLPWLLIYDNVEETFSDYPQKGGVILVTSQKKVLNSDLILEVLPFSRDEALQLLERITEEKKGKAMEHLVEDLEGIPLLINQTAHYIKSTPGCDVAEYRKLYNLRLFEREGPLWKALDTNQRYFKSLSASWQFPLKALEKENPLALEWLFVCGYLHAEQICEDWIDDWLADGRLGAKESLEMKKKEIFRALATYGTIRYEEQSKTFSLHRFFQHMIRETRKDHLKDDLYQTVSLLAKHAKDYTFSESSSWKKGQLWYLHACEVKKWLHLLPVSKTIRMQEALLYEGMGEWCLFNEAYPAGLESFRQALELRKSGLHSPDIGNTYQNLARVLVELGRYPEALEACEKAEEIQRHLLGEGAVQYAKTLNAKGVALYRQGRHAEGLICQQRALKIRLDNFNLSTPDIEANLNTIASAVIKISKNVEALRKRGQLQEAQQLHEKIVEMGKVFNNISRCYNGLGQLQKSLEFSEKAVAVHQANSGKEHPLSIWALERKAYVTMCLGHYSKALKIYQQTLALNIEIRGKEHADLAYSLEGMGWCYFHLREYKKAIKVFNDAFRYGLAPLGENAVGMVRAHNGIGWSYLKEGQVEEGLKYVTKHLQLCAKIYAHTPKMESDLEDFSKALQEALKHRPKAEAIQEAAREGYQISEEMVGKDHPLTRSFLDIIEPRLV
jgi:tetratricopeptide (TPR) repeat protein